MMKIVGVVLAMAGTNGVFNGYPLSEQGGVARYGYGRADICCGNPAIFLWGFRRSNTA